jgi:hypothetical protein
VNSVYFLVQAFINLKNKGRIKSDLPVLVGSSNFIFVYLSVGSNRNFCFCWLNF